MSETKQRAPYPLRMPDEMRDALKDAAKKNDRSLNAEIVARLDMTLIADGRGSKVGGEETSQFMTKVVMEAFDRWYDKAMSDGRAEGLQQIINTDENNRGK